MTRRNVVLFGMLALFAGCGIALFGRGAGGLETGSSDYVWRSGDEGAWRIATDSLVRFDSGQTARVEIDGTLGMRVFDVDDAVRVGLRLADARFVVDGRHDLGRSRLLTTPFGATFGLDGRALELSFPPKLDTEIATQLSEVVRTFVAVVPDASVERWTVLEEHATGRYRAVYSRVDGAIHKRKSAYLGGAGVAEAGAVVGVASVAVRASAARFELARGGLWLESARVEETLAMSTDGVGFATVELRARLVAAAARRDERLAAATDSRDLLATVVESVDLGAAQRAAPVTSPASAADRARCRELIAAFAESAGKDHDLIHALCELLVAHPDLAVDVGDGVRAGADEFVGGGLLHALQLGGNSDCQDELRELYGDTDLSRSRRRQAIAALGGVESPDDESVRALSAAADHDADRGLAQAALLALGRAGSSLAKLNAERYGPVAERLRTALFTAVDEDGAAAALKAIGNTRDAGFGELVTTQLGAASPAVRATAADVLGRLAPDGALGELSLRLTREPEARVRAALATGMARIERTDRTAFETVEAVVATERDADARRAMACYLADHLGAYPESQPTLRRLLETETDPRTLSFVAGRVLRSR